MKTAESITPRHPDKICDRISDAILDECLRQDKESRVAIETMGGHKVINITGELTTNASLNVSEIVKEIIGDSCKIKVNIAKQSPEIARGVDKGGAGDQGVMVGYACDENEFFLPQEFYLARDLSKYIYDKYPVDGKTQITINKKNEIEDIVASFNNVSYKELKGLVEEWLKDKKKSNPKKHINPAGDWSIGEFDADAGITGRKIVCDSYGPNVPVGGGAFSGKDPTKVDRSAAYMARKVAVDLLKKEKAKEVIVKVSYAIGKEDPVMVSVLKDGKEMEVKELDNKIFQPQNIIKELKLKRPIYQKTAEWGAFGNGFIWDKN